MNIIKTLLEHKIIKNADGLILLSFERGYDAETEVRKIVKEYTNTVVEVLPSSVTTPREASLYISKYISLLSSNKCVIVLCDSIRGVYPGIFHLSRIAVTVGKKDYTYHYTPIGTTDGISGIYYTINIGKNHTNGILGRYNVSEHFDVHNSVTDLTTPDVVFFDTPKSAPGFSASDEVFIGIISILASIGGVSIIGVVLHFFGVL